MANTILVPGYWTSSNQSTALTSKGSKNTDTSRKRDNATSTVAKTSAGGSSCIRRSLESQNFSSKVNEIILQSWRKPTLEKYESVLRRWNQFCSERNEDPIHPNIASVLDYFVHLHENGCMYSGLASARSALSSVVQIQGYSSLSGHPMVARFLKGIFNRYPPAAKYANIWDIDVLLQYYKSLPSNQALDFKALSQKLVALLMILGGRRKQALVNISYNNVVIEEDKLVLLPNITSKHSKPGQSLQPIIFKKFPVSEKLCVVNCVMEYIKRRNALADKNETAFIITYGKPHKQAKPDTISRWLKNELMSAGIDSSIYKAHSYRSASASKATEKGISYKDILKRGCWKTESTFQQFYKKDVISNIEECDYVQHLLK